ncbi:hypothetical protein GVAV_002626 [Gurleya vavrai]
MSKTKLYDCNTEETDDNLESKLLKQATKTTAKYLNFVQEGGNKKFLNLEKKIEKKKEDEKICEMKIREEQKIEKKIRKNILKKEEKMKRREEKRGKGSIQNHKSADFKEIMERRMNKKNSKKEQNKNFIKSETEKEVRTKKNSFNKEINLKKNDVKTNDRFEHKKFDKMSKKTGIKKDLELRNKNNRVQLNFKKKFDDSEIHKKKAGIAHKKHKFSALFSEKKRHKKYKK